MAFDVDDTNRRKEFTKAMLAKGVNLGVCGSDSVRLRPSLVIGKPHTDILLNTM